VVLKDPYPITVFVELADIPKRGKYKKLIFL